MNNWNNEPEDWEDGVDEYFHSPKPYNDTFSDE